MIERSHTWLRSAGSALALAATCLSLAACQSDGQVVQQSSSSAFSRVDMGAGSTIMPDACAVSDSSSDQLPPGCANAYNLQQMVVNQQDLMRGRRMGPAPAAPAARASNVYLYQQTGIPKPLALPVDAAPPQAPATTGNGSP
jgi:hypothetical protein